MHSVQSKLITLLKSQGSTPLKYREIGRRIGEEYPQTVKYHIGVLIQEGLVIEQNGFLKLNQSGEVSGDFLNLPFFGLAKCGEANLYASETIEDNADGFIKISKNILPKKTIADFLLVRATWNSMDRAAIGPNKRSIDNGDFVIVDTTKISPRNGDYVLSIIDWCANIKRFWYDATGNQIALMSESSDEYFPIVVHENDNYIVAGTVVEIIKQTKSS